MGRTMGWRNKEKYLPPVFLHCGVLFLPAACRKLELCLSPKLCPLFLLFRIREPILFQTHLHLIAFVIATKREHLAAKPSKQWC